MKMQAYPKININTLGTPLYFTNAALINSAATSQSNKVTPNDNSEAIILPLL